MSGNIFTASDPFFARMANVDVALEKAKGAISDKKMAEIDAASQDFEAMFISEMMQPMFETIPTDSEFGGGQAEETWKSMMIQEYGKKISAAGGIGLADSIKGAMIEMQSKMNSGE